MPSPVGSPPMPAARQSAGRFGADEQWWTNHIKINPWHAKFRNGPPDNLSLLDEIFGKAHVSESLAIPLLEDLGEDTEEAARVNIEGFDEDAELELSVMKKANLAKRKASTPVVNVLTIEDKNPLQLQYKKEDLGEDKEEATRDSTDGSGEDAELAPSAIKKARSTDRNVTSPMVDVSTTKEDRNPVPQKYKKPHNGLTATAEASSCDSSTVPTIRKAVGLIRECGVSEGTHLFYTATKIVALNPEYKELFALIRTQEGRLDWLQRAHDDTTTRVHFSTRK